MGKKGLQDSNMFEDESLRWYDAIPPITEGKSKPLEKKLENTAKQLKLKERGKELLEKVAEAHLKKKNTADERWIQKISNSGTTSDKIAASVIMIKEHPLSSLKTLQSLISQTKKKGGKSNIPVIENLRELFVDGLLPNARPLKYFRSQPWYSKDVTDKHLLYWVFEEEIKLCYSSYISTLEQLSKENVDYLRDISIKTLALLLTQHPEQERTILTALVNKIGDPVRKVASTTVTCLLGVLEEHPNMKPIIVREVELFMQRPKISEKAVYYSLILLNQVILTAKEKDTSAKLTEIYFRTFQKFMADESSLVQTRILTAILTGLNRCYNFVSQEKQAEFEEQTAMFYKIVHTSLFNRSTQGLILLFQIHSVGEKVPDRYFRALYERLLAPDLHYASKLSMFLNLLYRSINADPNTTRVYAFLKRCLQICAQAKPGLICGILFLISEIIRNRPKLWTCIQQPEETIAHGNDQNNENISYDPFKRDPQYSNANEACLWELNQFCEHFHPSVKSFANTLRNGEFIDYKGDPLLDFGTISFLDKFAFKNPRKEERLRGGSIMQSLRARKAIAPLNNPDFINKNENEVEAEHKFFHHYFQSKKKKQAEEKNSKVKTFESDSEEESDADDIDLMKAEEAALLGDISDDDQSPQEFDYDDIDFSEDEDDFASNPNEPTEDQLEAMLLADESDMDSDSENMDGPPSAFAAAEEYAKLLEDDVDQQTVEEFRAKRKKKKPKKKETPVGSKRKFSGKGKPSKRQKKR